LCIGRGIEEFGPFLDQPLLVVVVVVVVVVVRVGVVGPGMIVSRT